MRAAKFDPRRASNSNTSISNGREAGSQPPADGQRGLPYEGRITHGVWQQHPQRRAPIVQVQGAPTYQPGPLEPPRREAPANYRSTARPAAARPEPARPEPIRPDSVAQYRSTAPQPSQFSPPAVQPTLRFTPTDHGDAAPRRFTPQPQPAPRVTPPPPPPAPQVQRPAVPAPPPEPAPRGYSGSTLDRAVSHLVRPQAEAATPI